MIRPHPWCSRIVELAARLLPAGQRERYAREFVAELYDMPRPQQLRHTLQVLRSAWLLRAVLTTSPPTSREGPIMGSTARKSWKCVIGLHRWDWRTNPETSDHFEVCLRCDRYREKSPDASGAAS